MILKIFVDEHLQEINVPDEMISEAGEYFAMLDRDMDKGYQMSRTWVEQPDVYQRCQIVSDKILTALEQGNQDSATLLAAYILYRVPNAAAMHLNLEGDMTMYDLETR